jgi:predicted metal-dependent peptidase
MTPTAKRTGADEELLQRLEHSLRMVTAPFPHFAGLVRAVRIELDERVPTLGVFASGRLVANPQFVRTLREDELLFVLAHEVFHLALRTHDRAVGSDPLRFNFAHDYIINDILRAELQVQKIPAGGLDWPGARLLSAEEILLEMEKNPQSAPAPSQVWQGSPCAGSKPGRPGGSGGRPNPQAAGREQGPRGDVLDDQLEREWFSDESAADQQARAEALAEAAAKAVSLGAAIDAMKGQGRGRDGGGSNQMVTALRGLYRTPWEMALQRWLESVAPAERSFVRPSRRGADRTDVVLPGRKREGWVLNVVLDTSGSMTDEIPRALGAIADFCDAVAVDQMRLVQCDTAVTSDKFLLPSEVARHQVTGYGGSDLSPALRHLADDPNVEAVVVLTDGDIEYPQEEMPYNVLWVLPAHGSTTFHPPYGMVISMRSS